MTTTNGTIGIDGTHDENGRSTTILRWPRVKT